MKTITINIENQLLDAETVTGMLNDMLLAALSSDVSNSWDKMYKESMACVVQEVGNLYADIQKSSRRRNYYYTPE